METIKIYLADLTYDTVSLSTEAFPLNIGYIASYALDQFGPKIKISLFKYIEDLEQAILESPPDILGLSNYAWNHRIGYEMFGLLLEKNPHAVTVWGGPNFPMDLPSQNEFMNNYPNADVYVPIEGEVGFSNILQQLIESNASKINFKKIISENTIGNCVTRDNQNNLRFGFSEPRIKQLDEIPSPYLMGLMDKFFDGKLSPMLQTNRGCPFRCSYCVDGTDLVTKVNQFSLNRVKSEIEYISKNVPTTTDSMFISDLNFGMIPRDLEICDIIANAQKQYDFPKQIQATTGKNSKERIIEAILRLNGALRLWMSVQSMDQQVLENIRRDNISVDQMLALAPTIKAANLPTVSEVILGLPGESYHSHLKTLRDLVEAKMEDIQIYTCMMLHGAEMNTPDEREKWGLKTKFRILPRDFVKLSNGKKIVEIEEVVIASNTLSFDEYVELRTLAFSIFVTNIGIIYDSLIKLLREEKIDVFELFYRTIKRLDYASPNIQNIFDSYKNSTINELWNSPEEIENHIQNEEEYQKLLTGKTGINVVQYHHALVTGSYVDEWTDYILSIAKDLLIENEKFSSEVQIQFKNISNYCKGLSFNILNENSMDTNPEFEFNYNIENWLKDSTQKSLIEFKTIKPEKIIFKLTKEQNDVIKHKLDIFGDTPVGKGQVIKRIPRKMLWRFPANVS
jgi:radical SAM superfamily enzyme YgiQ (UPF0313 family)